MGEQGEIVFGAIAPHGSLAIPEACDWGEEDLASGTQSAMRVLAERFQQSRPDSAVLLTPHNIHVEGHMAMIASGTLSGSLEGLPHISLSVSTHRPLADAILRELRAVEVPVLSVTFAANDPAASVMPMDWATLIPLWYMGRAPEVPVVVMAPSRDLDAGQHVRAGHALAAAARAAGRRVAVIASADQGHAHDSAGPYGYDATSAEFDSRTADVIRAGDLSEFARFDPDWVRRAKADSWWQMLVLAGALGPGWRSELLSYEVPTYYGMLCAAFTRAHTPARDPA